MEISVGRSILEVNDSIATLLRKEFSKKDVLVVNMISSPGAGKTSLLERTLTDLSSEFCMAVIEGDLQTDNDAKRVEATGAKAVQINTNGGCHLDASMIENVLSLFDLTTIDILFIENVGNLVCPVEFDCGEDHKIAILSVAEGDDKPEKYPLLFNLASCLIINKKDLLPYVDFDVEKAKHFASKLNKDLSTFTLSCRSGESLEQWYDWLRGMRAQKKSVHHGEK